MSIVEKKAIKIPPNNFNIIRWIAAAAVIFSHSFPLYKGDVDPLSKITNSQLNIGALAVDIFFIISGFLIAYSYLRSRNWSQFLLARILRIFPALIVVILIQYFILGPVVSNLDGATYFSQLFQKGINLLSVDTLLPGVFTFNIYPNAVNGSLWTIIWEFRMYLMVLILGLCNFINKKIIGILFICTSLLFVLNKSGILPFQDNAFRFLSLFCTGMVLLFYIENIVALKWRYLLLLSPLLFIGSRYGILEPVITIIGAPFFMKACFIKNSFVNEFGKNIDLSYGIYLYAFPIQQIISQYFFGKLNLFMNFLIVFSITLIFAVFSWFFIEKRCLKFKNILGKKITNHKKVSNTNTKFNFGKESIFNILQIKYFKEIKNFIVKN